VITYKYDEEKIVALHFANRLNENYAVKIIENGIIESVEEATFISNFFWRMNAKAIADDEQGIKIPCDGSSEYWIEKIYNSWEGYMLKNSFISQWDEASDNA
jgi:hypothetical protein